MARIILPEIENVLYSTEITVRYDDINSANHMSNEMALAYALEARLRYFQDSGFAQQFLVAPINMVNGDGCAVYKQELFWRDQVTVKVGVSEFNKYGFDMNFDIYRNNALAIQAKTGLVFFDFVARKITPVPEGVSQFFS